MEEINRDCSKCYKLYSSCGWVGKDCQYKNNSEILKQLKQKEKELGLTLDSNRILMQDNVAVANENTKLKQALDEIEKYAMNVICDDCVNGLCDDCVNNHILQIIEKAKEQ